MKNFLRFLPLVLPVFFALASLPAFAQSGAVVFPPADCSSDEERAITWKDGSRTTHCRTMQQVVKMAIPDCRPNQYVAVNGRGEFHCRDFPNCGAGEVLTSNDSSGTREFHCMPGMPHCSNGQYVVYHQEKYICRSLPACDDDSYVYAQPGSGGLVQLKCRSLFDSIPTCDSNQVLTARDKRFVCVNRNGDNDNANGCNVEKGNLCGNGGMVNCNGQCVGDEGGEGDGNSR